MAELESLKQLSARPLISVSQGQARQLPASAREAVVNSVQKESERDQSHVPRTAALT